MRSWRSQRNVVRPGRCGARVARSREIAERLGVARSTVSVWVRDILLSEAQQAALDEADPVRTRRRTGHLAWSRHCRERRRAAQEHGRALARAGDALHQAGCMLFWAEGSRSRNSVVFSNADVEMQRLFLRFVRRCYAVADEQVSLTINCFLGNGLSVAEIEAAWLTALDLPSASLLPTVVNRPSRASKRVHRPLRLGTARVVVNSTWITQSLYGAIQEYAGFDRPEWLDLAAPSQPVLPPPTVSDDAA